MERLTTQTHQLWCAERLVLKSSELGRRGQRARLGPDALFMVGDHIEAMSSARRPRVRLTGRRRLHSGRPGDAPGHPNCATTSAAPDDQPSHRQRGSRHALRQQRLDQRARHKGRDLSRGERWSFLESQRPRSKRLRETALRGRTARRPTIARGPVIAERRSRAVLECVGWDDRVRALSRSFRSVPNRKGAKE